jgi:hypothetical protein
MFHEPPMPLIKGLFTLRTAVRFFLGVSSHVHLQRAGVAKPLLADHTKGWPLSGVAIHVKLKILRIYKCLLTVCTLVWLLPSVDSTVMCFTLALCEENLFGQN